MECSGSYTSGVDHTQLLCFGVLVAGLQLSSTCVMLSVHQQQAHVCQQQSKLCPGNQDSSQINVSHCRHQYFWCDISGTSGKPKYKHACEGSHSYASQPCLQPLDAWYGMSFAIWVGLQISKVVNWLCLITTLQDDWLPKVGPVIQDRIDRYAKNEIRFNLMAVIHDRREQLSMNLALAANKRDRILARLAGDSATAMDMDATAGPSTSDVGDLPEDAAQLHALLADTEAEISRWV